MLNWWEANQFRMPANQGGRYKPSLLDYPSMTPPEAKPQAQPSLFARPDNGGSGVDDDGALGGFGGAPGAAATSPASQSASTGKSSPASMGTIGSLAGMGATLASGVPGIGTALGAIGTVSDVKGINDDLTAIGQPGISYGKALANSAMMGIPGMFGALSPMSQVEDTLGFGINRAGLTGIANAVRGLDSTITGFDIDPVTGTVAAKNQGAGGWGGIGRSATDIANAAGVYGGLSQPGYADPGLAPSAQAAARGENPGYGGFPAPRGRSMPATATAAMTQAGGAMSRRAV